MDVRKNMRKTKQTFDDNTARREDWRGVKLLSVMREISPILCARLHYHVQFDEELLPVPLAQVPAAQQLYRGHPRVELAGFHHHFL